MGGFTSVLLERLKPLIFRTTRFQTDFELPVQVLEKHLEEREAELRQAGRQELFVVRSHLLTVDSFGESPYGT